MSRAQSRAPRWPDLLIGLLVLLLLAGFAALLLSQRPAPVAQTPTPVTEAPPTIVIPGAPGTDLDTGEDPAEAPAPAPESAPAPQAQAPAPQETPAPPAETPASETPAAEAPTPEAPPSQAPATESPTAAAPTPQPPATTPQAETPEPAPPASTTPDPAAVVPADPIPAAPPPPPAPAVTLPRPPATPPGAAPSTPAPDQTPGQAATTPPAAPAAPPRSGGAVATSEQRTPLRSDYRISLGTFGGESGAQQAAQGVRSLGYTVYSIDLGEQVVAQIGPFADEATARRALADIQRAYPRAVLYPPRGRNLTGGGVSETASAAPAASPEPQATPAEPEAPPAASAPERSTPEPEAATERAPAPSGPVYLQVGAFDRTESAQRLVGLLREEGYAPTVNAPEGRKVTVLIGPFSGDALTRAEENLDAGGFDHFRVR